jgi:galactosylceramidase
MHTRTDQDYQRGYEWWLMHEARRRNPAILLDCLEWGAPAWIGDGYFNSQDNADYLANFLKGAQRVHGLNLDYVGVWNETRADMGWIKRLRRTLDRNRLQAVQIVAADDINRWTLVDVMQTDPELARAIAVVGVHYPKYRSTTAAQACGKPIWASEDGPWAGDWAGAMALAKMYNRNYLEGKMTKTIIWSPITCYYDNLPLPGSGVMRANSPWSGHYEVQPALWATAHTTQFAQPGWKYLDGEAAARLPGGGSLVTLRSPGGSDYSVVVETSDATAPQKIAFELRGGLSGAPLHVWRSRAADQFVQLAELAPREGKFTVTFDPGCLYSLTTTGGQVKGSAVGAPPAEFPFVYAEDFERYPPGATPRYLADQAGVFEVARRWKGKGRCLRQVVDHKGIEWPFHLNPYPESFLGNANWSDYTITVEALIEKTGFVSLFGRVGKVPQSAAPPEGYWLKVDDHGYWELGTASLALASGQVPFSAGTWHKLGLRFAGTRITAFIDDRSATELTEGTHLCGMVGIGSGWHHAQFDNLSIRVEPSDANLAFGRRTTASSEWDVDHGAGRATDGNAFNTRWNAADGKTAGEWLEIDLGARYTFNSATLKPFEDRITAYRLQWWDGAAWQDAFQGENLGSSPKRVQFATVTATRVRLLVTAAKASPALSEFEVRYRP